MTAETEPNPSAVNAGPGQKPATPHPTPKIAENSHNFRPLGLGYANLGALLMSMALPYDSEKDFAPVALVSGVPFILVVNAALPVRSIADLVQYAKGSTSLRRCPSGPALRAPPLGVLYRD